MNVKNYFFALLFVLTSAFSFAHDTSENIEKKAGIENTIREVPFESIFEDSRMEKTSLTLKANGCLVHFKFVLENGEVVDKYVYVKGKSCKDLGLETSKVYVYQG